MNLVIFVRNIIKLNQIQTDFLKSDQLVKTENL